MRPVNRGNPINYAPPATVSFQAANAALLGSLGLANPRNPNLTALLALADGIAEADASGAAITADQKKAWSLAVAKVGPVYRGAGNDLWARIGAYCSFCESPLTSQFDVEHTMPKTPYPAYAVTWANFLVGCTSCNSQKGNDPTRGWVYDEISPTIPNPTIADYYTWVRTTHYEWPDLNPATYREVPTAFTWYSGPANTRHTLLPVDTVNPQITQTGIDYVNRYVLGNVVDPVLGPQANVRTRAYPAATAGNAANVQDMIDLCGLDDAGTTITDRRMVNRTLAWYAALRAARMVLQAANQPDFQSRFDVLADSARGTGFYSTWVRLLAQLQAPPAAGQPPGTTLAQVFVAWPAVQAAFPGTNTAQVP